MNVPNKTFEPSDISSTSYNEDNLSAVAMNQAPLQVEMSFDANSIQPMRIQSEHNSLSNLKPPPIKSTDTKANQLPLVHKTPQKFDILCGKEKVCINHEGSRHFRKVIDLYCEKYQQCTTKHEKMMITKEIYINLQQSLGSRFLKYNSKSKAWDEISEIVARDKISHALRFACLKQKEQQRQQLKEQQKKANGTSGKKVLHRSSTFSAMSSYARLHPGMHQFLTTESTSSEEASLYQVSTTTSDASTTKEASVKIANPAMRRCGSDPLPIKMWNQFVERQQNLMRSIQKETIPSVASASETKATSPVIEQNQTRLMKIIDERPDLIMKVPLLSMNDCSEEQIDEDDIKECSDVFD